MRPQYLVGHLRQLLARDPRTNLLDVQVRVVGQRVYIAGSVESASVSAAAERVVREAIPHEMTVVNELWVVSYVP
jgi:osmotically-inducible protein OsmY